MKRKKLTLSLLLSVLFVSPGAISAVDAHSHGSHARPVSYGAQKSEPIKKTNATLPKSNCNLGDTHNCR